MTADHTSFPPQHQSRQPGVETKMRARPKPMTGQVLHPNGGDIIGG